MLIQTPNSTFDAKADRYLAAMDLCGKARLSELAPISSQIPAHASSLLDLFGGSGFVSQCLGWHFRKISMIDQAGTMLPQNTSDRRVIHGDALDESILRQLDHKYDLAVCMAGFHHILPGESSCKRGREPADHRLSALNSWRRVLSPSGRLIVADVVLPCHEISQFSLLKEEKSFLVKELGDESHSVKMACEKGGTGNPSPEPANFLDNFVGNRSPFGHEGIYETPRSLCHKMEAAGFANVKWQIRYTPWFFADLSIAMWFMGELFAIGNAPCKDPQSMSASRFKLLKSGVEKDLGYLVMPDGRCLVNWKLLYVWGDNDGI